MKFYIPDSKKKKLGLWIGSGKIYFDILTSISNIFRVIMVIIMPH